MVKFIWLLKLEREKGKIREISISKIKNKIITKKNCIEKLLWEGVWESNPHSKETHFCVSISDNKDKTFIKNKRRKVSAKLIKKIINIVISMSLISKRLNIGTIKLHPQNVNTKQHTQIL